ncbi:hypothetical protein XELAEV_18042861mg [Xenopus laevis]|uniref:Uncharacterized protein n=1 Tax=Xenopus laevis TaxID=8355 RepID=A0A974C4X6_XENLA|nr:hypothetical protein XELAEV_18042861mg [Xenopus laevis]
MMFCWSPGVKTSVRDSVMSLSIFIPWWDPLGTVVVKTLPRVPIQFIGHCFVSISLARSNCFIFLLKPSHLLWISSFMLQFCCNCLINSQSAEAKMETASSM